MSNNAHVSSSLAVETTSKQVFGESDPWVLVAYFLAFGIWTTASGNDFISSTWKSVRDTRRRGKLHVACVYIPMTYISVYIYFQHVNRDYKEMGAAILALAFAVLHLVRTFMGLWQLHMFKQWTISSIKSMESLGYETRSPNTAADDAEDSDSEDEGDEHGELGEHGDVGTAHDHGQYLSFFFNKFQSGGTLNQDERRIEKIADAILVNDSLIDNRLSDVHTVCHPRLMSNAERKIVKKAKHVLLRHWYALRYGIVNVVRVIRVLFSLALMKAPFVPNTESGPVIVPLHPESVWLHWATALVAQVGWMVDDNAHSDPDPIAEYEEHRDHFAEEILLSAALHTQRMSSRVRHATEENSNGTRCSHENDFMSGFLSFHEWHNFPKLRSGKFSKQEFLRRACKTGSGLPYRTPHSNARERKGGSKQYGYAHFASELVRAREALPPEIERRVESFDVEKLEWFTIFVSVENWTPGRAHAEEEVRSEIHNDSEFESTSNLDRDDSMPENVDPENDIPIQNVKKQLGFVKKTKFILRNSKLPFLRSVPKAILWGNRNVLETSCHIDNWIALCAGDQASYTIEHVPWMKRKTGSSSSNSSVNDANLKFDRAVQESADFEKCKTLCEMVTLRPEHFHFDKSTTFLGCSMEMLRSSLAKWAETHNDSDEESWKPPLFSGNAGHENDKRIYLDRFEGSKDLSACLRSLRSVSHMSERFVKMRILWELQNHFQNHLLENGASPKHLEAIALCILSFPTVSIDVRKAEYVSEAHHVVWISDDCDVDQHDGNANTFQVRNYKYVIRATCGPQDLQLVLSFDSTSENDDELVSMYLCEAEEAHVAYFDWEVWRNSFYGRLESCRRWKQKLGLPHFPLIPSTRSITSGVRKFVGQSVTLQAWDGWLPHYASACMYEMTTDGLIREAREDEGASLPLSSNDKARMNVEIPREVWVTVRYDDASAAALKSAFLRVQELLQYASTIPHDDGDDDDDDVVDVDEQSLDPENAQNILEEEEGVAVRESEEDISMALVRLESEATEHRSIPALKKAMSILLRGGRKSVARGVLLLERFYAGGKQATMQKAIEFCANEHFVKTVKSLFEVLFKASNYDRNIAIKYHSFLLVLIRYGGKGSRKAALSVLFRSIIYRSHTMDIVEAAASIMDFSRYLSGRAADEFATLNLAFSNIVRGVELATKGRPHSRRTLRCLKLYADRAKRNLSIAENFSVQQTGGFTTLEEFEIRPHRPDK